MFVSLASLFSSFILPVTWGLLHAIWQAALIALLLGVVLRVLKERRPQLRYSLSCLALLLMVLLPVLTALRHAGQTVENPGVTMAGDHVAETADTATIPLEQGSPEETFQPAGTADRQMTSRLPWLVRSRLYTILPGPESFMVIFMLWLAGVVAFGIIHFFGWRRVHRLTTRGTSPLPDFAEEMVAELNDRLRSVPKARVVQSALAQVPTVIGWLRPVVLIPVTALTGLDRDQLRAIIAHELAHVQRFDYLVNLLQVGAETVFFYHPAIWWVSRRIRRERELCCDDTAVALCGNRLLYARALLSLEELRPAPRPVLAATGGSLSERIHRLLGGKPMSQTQRARPYLAGLLMVSTLLLGCSVMALEADAAARRIDSGQQASGILSPPPAPGPGETVSTSPGTPGTPLPGAYIMQSGDQDRWQGRWEIHTGENGLHLELRYGPEGERESGWGTTMDQDRFTGLDFDRRDEFELRAEAGTISFTGGFTRTRFGHEGEGTYTFEPNRDFPRDLARLGIDDVRDRHLLGYAMGGVTIAMVREVQDLGYRDLDADEVQEMAIFQVTAEFIRELRQLGYDDLEFRRLVEFRIHGVSPDFIRALADEGFTRLSAGRLVEFRIHGVSPEFIHEMQSSGFDLDAQGLIEFRIHGVSPEFMREMAELGYRNLGSRRLVEFRIHGVTPEFIRELGELGYRDLETSQLVEFRIHGVTPSFIRGLQRDGYEDLSPRRLVEYRIHGVSPEFAREMERSGIEDLDRDDLVEFRIHGVTPEFAAEMAELGYTDLTGRQLIEFRIHGVTPDLVRGLNRFGFRDIPARRLVETRIYGVTLEYIRYVREERELTDLDLEEIIKLKKYNIIKP